MTVTKTIQMFGVQTKSLIVMFHQGFDDGSGGHFDSHSHLLCWHTGMLVQPGDKFLYSRAAMPDLPFCYRLPFPIQHTDLMVLCGPINAHKK